VSHTGANGSLCFSIKAVESRVLIQILSNDLPIDNRSLL
jgi:hypothetical protein